MTMQRLLRLSVLVLAILTGAACTILGDVPGDADYPISDDGIYNPYGIPLDPLYRVSTAAVGEGDKQRDANTYAVPPKNVYVDDHRQKKEPDPVYPRETSKISPILQQWLKEKAISETVDVIITFKNDMPIPRLPLMADDESREKGGTRRDKAIDTLIRGRAESQGRQLRNLVQYGEFKQAENFWIVNSVVGKTTLGEVVKLAESRDVVYLQPVQGGEKPPQDANNNNDALDGRAWIDSDPYFSLGLTSPWIGLLDTGVRETHEMFNSPDHIAWMRDCVNGGTNCSDTSAPGYDPTDFSWNHGTRSAGLLIGNMQNGNAFRGVTEIRMDSWQIYTAGGLNTAAAVRGIQAGVRAFDKVLVGEIQAAEADNGTIATAADNAYDAGIIFVSANGNFGPNASTVRSPGIAHKVLGVGGFMTDGGAQYNNQGRGPANDGRFKPDIQAPTWSETASGSSDTALGVFTGTSGATPYAAAAAMLSRNWLRRFGTFDNGQTYAFMILYGQDPYPYNNTVGAGKLEMATNGWAWWGKVAVGDRMNVDIPINVPANRQNFDGALWWPESESQDHNDIDIHLIDPSGIERARGYSSASVFERAAVDGNLQTGTWTLRIRGYRIRTGTQTVYWASHIQRN
jgi:hypothetical protein